ncbi:MAG: ferrochelatase, partial [candidate division WOR-3 bacterium]
MRKVRVLLVNTGAVIDFSSYFSFLFRMFTDIAIMPLPLLLRYPLALLIATVRPFFGYHKYRKIGKSPLIEIMHTQAELLRERLKGYDIEVYPCCLYSKPLLDEFLSDKSFNVTVIIPQFPHYSKSTTGSIEIRVCHKNLDSVKIVRSYH